MAFEHPEAFQEIAPQIEIEGLKGKIQLLMGAPGKHKLVLLVEDGFLGSIVQEFAIQ